MHYYQFNIGDYRRQTAHLTILEHGIYKNLLDTYYLSEQPLCADIAKLMRSQSIRSAEEKEALENVLSDFFYLADDGYRNKTCDSIIAKYHLKSDKARKSAEARWKKPKEKQEDDANALQTDCEGNANHKPITNNQEPINNSLSSLDDEKKAREKLLISEVMDLYNTIKSTENPNWTAIEQRTSKRVSTTRQRIRDVQSRLGTKDHRAIMEWFTHFFTSLAKNNFYSGRPTQNKPNGYKWEYGQLMREDTFVKAYERLNEGWDV